MLKITAWNIKIKMAMLSKGSNVHFCLLAMPHKNTTIDAKFWAHLVSVWMVESSPVYDDQQITVDTDKQSHRQTRGSKTRDTWHVLTNEPWRGDRAWRGNQGLDTGQVWRQQGVPAMLCLAVHFSITGNKMCDTGIFPGLDHKQRCYFLISESKIWCRRKNRGHSLYLVF